MVIVEFNDDDDDLLDEEEPTPPRSALATVAAGPRSASSPTVKSGPRCRAYTPGTHARKEEE
jgi:hypothetical protein